MLADLPAPSGLLSGDHHLRLRWHVPAFDEASGDLLGQIARLQGEATEVHRQLVLPSWGSSAQHGLPATLWGYVMSAFAFVDLVSYYVAPPAQGQSARMRAFLEEHLDVEPDVAAVAVQLWRHTLMHTGMPRSITSKATGERFLYLLHWGDELPRQQHLRLLPGHTPSERIIGLSLLALLEDLHSATLDLTRTWAASASSQRRVQDQHERLLRAQRV